MAMRPVPAMYPVTQGFWANATIYNYGAGHGAIDYGVPMNTPLLAPEDGVVVFDGWAWDLPGGPYDWAARWFQIKPTRGDTRTGGGIMTIIRNAVGSHWVIAHANRSLLNVGDVVREGQLIQETGTTGSSTGPHSHVSLIGPNPNWANGYFGAIDPAPYITKPYQPLTHVSWEGSPTEGKGSPTPEGDWFDMADKDDLKAALREVLREPAVQAGIVKAVLDEPIAVWGTDPETGKRYGGHTSLRLEAGYGTFRGFRDRRIEKNTQDIAEAVRPSTLRAVLNTTNPTQEN